MKRIQSHVLIALLLATFLFVPQVAFAHLVWINTTDYTPTFHERFGARTKVYFGYGHKYPVHDFIYATYSGFSTDDDFAYATGTNANGMTRIRILHYGPWLIKADIKIPAPAELKDKCRQLHYTATLTFEVE